MNVETVASAAIVARPELRAMGSAIIEIVVAQANVEAIGQVVVEAVVQVAVQAAIHTTVHTVVSHAIQRLKGRVGWLESVEALAVDGGKVVLMLNVERIERTGLHALT